MNMGLGSIPLGDVNLDASVDGSVRSEDSSSSNKRRGDRKLKRPAIQPNVEVVVSRTDVQRNVNVPSENNVMDMKKCGEERNTVRAVGELMLKKNVNGSVVTEPDS